MSQGRVVGAPVLYKPLAGLLCCLCCQLAICGPPACAPQGLLQLDKPYPPPYRVNLPFCDQYRCSCCNASHALSIQRSVRHLMLDDELSQLCKSGLVMLACSVCDPEVGVGDITGVCFHTCQKLFEDCSKDFFTYDDTTGSVVPCTSQSGMSLVCSQLTEVVHDGATFCQALGHASRAVNDIRPSCFEGVGSGRSDCLAPPKQQSRPTHDYTWPVGIHASQHRWFKQAGQLLLGALTMASVAVAVLCVLHRLMKRNQAKFVNSQDVHTAREILAKAADARAAKGRDQRRVMPGSTLTLMQKKGRFGES